LDNEVMGKKTDMKTVLSSLLAAQQAAEARGDKEFTCPLCGGTVHFGRASNNNHLHLHCTGCGIQIAE